MERLEGQPVNFFRMGAAILTRDAEQIGPHVAEREVTTYIRRGQLLGEHGTIESRKNPLRKIVRKPLREEVVAPHALKCGIKDRGVTALLQAIAQFTEGCGGLIPKPPELGNSDNPERRPRALHNLSSSNPSST